MPGSSRTIKPMKNTRRSIGQSFPERRKRPWILVFASTDLEIPLTPTLVLGLLLLSASLQADPAADTSLRYADLVHQLTDLEHLAVPPPIGERGAQASSYDRASRYDAEHDRYLNWDANGDGSGIIRREGEQSVLAEITGPGCIRRTWSATPGQGHVRIWLDGAEQPAVDLPFIAYFDRKNEPFTRPNLVYKTEANGFNNYTPIPFQKSCRIVADKGWGNYYHFTYTRFAPGTTVPTFSRQLSPEDAAALDRADRALGNCGKDPAGDRPGQETVTRTVDVMPGQQNVAAELDGPRAITALRVRLPLPKDIEQQRTLLRQLTLQIRWDDDQEPAVWAPLGDFFASAAGAVPFRSLPAGLTEDGSFYSYWYMPFAKKAQIILGNDGPQPVSVGLEIVHAPLTQPAESLLRFHAKWHRDAFMPERPDRWPDWTILTTHGRGRFVGVVLHVWNPRGGWWGEGDEKFFVDGEKFPSTFGTGSEDYFGYAWSSGKTFVRALHDQPVNEDNHGHVSVDRWEIAENVPFQESFEGCIEKYFPNKKPTLYAAVAYWYLEPGGKDPYTALPVEQRVGYCVRPQITREPGVIEGESLHVTSKTADPVGPQPMDSFGPGWSGDSQLWWRCSRAGEKLDLGFPCDKAGKYRLLARFTRAPDYGKFQLRLDGQDLGHPIDLYAPRVMAANPMDLGTIDLSPGQHVLSVEAMGKNDASGGMFFGLDYLKLASPE